MGQNSNQRSFFLAPMAHDVGLTSMALGLVRALQRDGIDVGFIKPISQPEAAEGEVDLSTTFAKSLCHIDTCEPITFAHAEEMVRQGQLSALLEDVVALVETVRARNDVVVIEGLIPNTDLQIASLLNAEMARSLSANLIPVISAAHRDAHDLAEHIALAQRQFGVGGQPFAGILINKLPEGAKGERLREDLARIDGGVPLLAAVPFSPRLNAPRLLDLVNGLGLKVERSGNLASRVHEIVVAARSVENMVDRLRPGALVVTPGDRSDIVLATALASLRGVPLAGLLLTCGEQMPQSIASLIPANWLSGLPILSSELDTYATTARLANLSSHVGGDDAERMEQVIEYISEHVTTAPLKQKIGEPRELKMPPPAFRNRLVQLAKQANKRVVLPEGDEPRTLQAAVICHEKGLAHCVLLGDPTRIRQVADAQGLTLPADIEILDPEKIRENYVAPMVEMRKSKGLTPQQASAQLEDTVVLGTVMLAVGEVDGLVSGAVHTTASTVRPALQLIKTAPGQSIVSSVFFMLMPDQVLVYGDCAINPNPSAEQLADIAIQSAGSAKAFGVEPRVAMISYSTGTSGVGDDVEKVREATRIAREKCPDLLIDGPIQYDAASVESVGRQKAPDSKVAGRANVFVFPDLNTGNTTYKAVQRSANVVSVGPMLQGLRKPVNDLSRGALVDDIVYTIALTAIQAV
ncbi:phosphate acetyltransferase [Telmatospirillum siberiense]|uniref:Phosphate acetyltransferase n=1 Tax=Telmatospirillum siberiense TaxID=382514 RepID=A0A2N3PX87_9PROT|nr:phosphate acetyltransferase [Telmatospirillum siberiense]PKU25022.1 phosphate acetyltransferase [Telmatospirillum siberiense]